MGSGIAQVTAHAGVPVTVVDVSHDRLGVARKSIEGSLARVGKKQHPGDEQKGKAFVEEVVSRITFTTDERLAASNAGLIVEAIVEKIDAKKKLWKKIDGMAPKECVFCTNTSSLSVGEQAAATSRPDRFAGLHFFSPVPMMKLVEVVRAAKTSQGTVDQLLEYVKLLNKQPVLAVDTKGFIVNRLLVPYQLEACRLVERGVASVEDVDLAMKLGCGHPMGPFALADSVGIDVLKFIADAWHKEEPENPLFTPSKLLDEKFAQGKLGRKTGEGFYIYTR
ncbi:putative short chain 3-hydroxyacyl-CoA dehydrogenase [Trypanosoma conorhini]|uniref:Putative short chain 3-hydroxyacyl-CoA dehydrogenase n=1 Tax=Trypanosoma conorhini TaxID=83891 RepID=A0A422NDK9_9TRYP|nr:putative short chain 3-hydroxyacyl-CoA dehydrogenase [Trypanosoma conorhini]RNF03472.1 putative short chain 3-hydroxyacyl-CoA dehydrogenase [Trypanosoma conorhini]